VAEEAVIGVPDPKWTERPQALLVAEADQEVSEVQIRTQLKNFAAKGIIPRYSVPEQIVLVEALPKTSVASLGLRLLAASVRLPRFFGHRFGYNKEKRTCEAKGDGPRKK
jgi:fatty-acyl-CoA synthase